MSINIRPLGDRLIVERMEEEQMSAGGIVIPDSAKEKPSRGTVLAVGEGKVLDNGSKHEVNVKVGDKVLFGKYAGTEVNMNDKDLIVMREDDVMGVIEA